MKLIDRVTDWIAETNLMEMAFERKQIVSKCIDLAHQIDIHMIKVVWLSNSIDANHWSNELNAWFGKIQDMKYNRNMSLSGDQYYKVLFLGYLDGADKVEKLLKNPIKRGEIDISEKNDLSPQQVYEKLEKMFHAICYDISNDKFEDIANYL